MSEAKKQLVDAFIEAVRFMNRKAGYSDKGIHELRDMIDTAIQETIDSATAELRRELEEVKRQLWGAERRVVNLETERDTLKREVEELRGKLRRAEVTIDELNQNWIDENL